MAPQSKIRSIILSLSQQILLGQCILVIDRGNFGDVLSNLLKFNGNKVVKEYYINDVGSQIDNFTESVF